MKFFLSILFLFLLVFTPFVSSSVIINQEDALISGVFVPPRDIIINFSIQNVSSAEFWDSLNTPSDIIGLDSSNIDDIYLFNTGDTATGNYTFDTSTLFIDSSTDRVGIGTTTPDSIFHIKANVPGVVGSHSAGQLIIQNPADTVWSNVIITAYESDGSGNPDQQLWYLGSSSTGNSDITFLNRRNSKLQLGTSGTSRITILGSGNVGINTTAPQNTLNVIGSINQTTGNLTGDFVYGEIHFHNDTTGNVTALTEDAWANFTGFDQDYSGQILHSITYLTSRLTILMDGVYAIDYSNTFSGTANNKYHVAVGVGGVIQFNCESHDRIDNINDILGTHGTCFLSLNAGEEITLMIMNEDSGGDSTTLSANLNMVRIGN